MSSGFGSSSAAMRDVHCWAASVANIWPSMKHFIAAISAVVGRSLSLSPSVIDWNHSSYMVIVEGNAEILDGTCELFVVFAVILKWIPNEKIRQLLLFLDKSGSNLI